MTFNQVNELLKRAFSGKGGQLTTKPPENTMPKPGEVWALNDGSPWPMANAALATILDIKGGWVRYDMCPGWSDQRMELSYFLKIYKIYKK